MDKLSTLLDEAYDLFNKKEFKASLEKLQEAQNILGSVTEHDTVPEDRRSDTRASVENFKGFNYLSLGQTEKAQECFEKALSINPNSSQACAGLAEIFYLQGMDYESKIMFEWAIENNTMNQFAIAGLKKVNKALNLPEDHNTLNTEASFFEVKNNQFFDTLKEAYKLFNEKKYEDSLKTLNAAEKVLKTRKDKFNSSTRIASLENFRGFNLLALDRVEEARKSFEKALSINPSSSQACAGLGEIFYLLGRDSEAKTMFEWAVVNNEKNHFARTRLSKLNTEMGLPADDNSLLTKTETETAETVEMAAAK
ncbi:MAG: tetratricopeptide repeat protein [Ignavibacteria bacterium]|nr:MAG: tetratricopeptide repeat protein [Ignavibacteria bacterium]